MSQQRDVVNMGKEEKGSSKSKEDKDKKEKKEKKEKSSKEGGEKKEKKAKDKDETVSKCAAVHCTTSLSLCNRYAVLLGCQKCRWQGCQLAL